MIDLKQPLYLWTLEDLKEHLRRLSFKIPFMFMPTDISKEEVKEHDDIMNDAEKIRKEISRRQKGKTND